jgi:1-acyl-sn-glycerol-3-phosphate acyltransferase
MKRIPAIVFGIYAALVFIITLLISSTAYALVFLFASKKSAPHIAHKGISRPWAKTLQILFFSPMKVKNRHLIDRNTTYVFIANHQSQLDIPFFAVSCANTFRFLAKAELTKLPFMGFIIRNLYIAVDRKDRADRHRSLEIMKASLDENISVFLCPEGTRNKHEDPPLLDFKDGAFRLAVLTGTPIAPLTILNTGRRLSPLHPVAFYPGALYGIWDEPISTAGLTISDIPALKEQVRAKMIKRLQEFRKRNVH